MIVPGNGLEYAGDATNPVDAVSGLHAITEVLLRYPGLPSADRDRIKRIHGTLPPIPVGRRQGVASVLPARSYHQDCNKWEPIEHNVAFPNRRIGVVRPDSLRLLRDTWDTIPEDRARLCKQDSSWMANLANAVAMASPGLATRRAIYKMGNTTAPQARSPAFFGPGHDWLPDFNWGGAGMTGVEEMLLCPEPGAAGKLHLFAGWPADRDVEFKLHAPGKTLVEASLKDGDPAWLKITPELRLKDVVNWLDKHPEWRRFTRPVSLAQGKPVTTSSHFDEPGYDLKLANDGDLRTRWASGHQARSGWLEIDLGKDLEIGSFVISEIEWPETCEFAVEVKQGAEWQEVALGTTIGADKSITITPTTARYVRLNVKQSADAININEFQVFAP